ncbi:MAG: hypothetical protein KBH94_03260 [Caldisericia bacterium]|nr:hypothetical protein [Caldisericia bacterium]
MNIRSANESDISYIANSLSDYFERTNFLIGFPKYKNDSELMLKVVSNRISDKNSEYKYIVAEDDKGLHGFLNILTSEESPEILIIIGDSKEVKGRLLDEAINLMSSLVFPSVIGEMNKGDELEDLIKEKPSEIIQLRYKMNLSTSGK